jgi:hypothetical protein
MERLPVLAREDVARVSPGAAQQVLLLALNSELTFQRSQSWLCESDGARAIARLGAPFECDKAKYVRLQRAWSGTSVEVRCT